MLLSVEFTALPSPSFESTSSFNPTPPASAAASPSSSFESTSSFDPSPPTSAAASSSCSKETETAALGLLGLSSPPSFGRRDASRVKQA